ncbi:DUF2470 domain-containing protein [Glaciihabitans sp. INWT7]|uniref:DUF2470 domain-containing protein n=1 Tax=Glaciihabitans sp. INWT7 TaxID=2596912 RepID=UPI0018603F72|nr:DUF2470 domain-containing protein [Glaciihabitans sp. INWT7]QNE48222.1 DUF2470 domain-containing protein [Glaciihabitans sp. INWT7]
MPDSPVFPPAVVAAVLSHMNSDHADDNLLIARAFADPAAAACTMTSLDGEAGYWSYVVERTGGRHERDLRMPWAAAITERAEIRREIVSLYDQAHARLGTTPREH